MGKLELESFVFANEDGTPISPNYFSIMWSRSVARAGLPKVTFHGLRHSHASALIRAGLDVVRVANLATASQPSRLRLTPTNLRMRIRARLMPLARLR